MNEIDNLLKKYKSLRLAAVERKKTLVNSTSVTYLKVNAGIIAFTQLINDLERSNKRIKEQHKFDVVSAAKFGLDNEWPSHEENDDLEYYNKKFKQ